MLYQPKNIELPRDGSVWRYMDFAKFVSLLQESALFFCRADRFEDKWEGVHSFKTANSEFAKGTNYSFNVKKNPKKLPPWEMGDQIPFAKFLREYQIPSTFLNCWHRNDFESAGMWSLYSKNADAIAILSSTRRLKSVFEAAQIKVVFGEVQYLDYSTETTPFDPFHHEESFYLENLPVFFCKRKSFEHEKEVRAAVVQENINLTLPGISIQADLNHLIDKIFVSPTAPAWLHKLTKAVVGKYGYQWNVERSSLADDPIM